MCGVVVQNLKSGDEIHFAVEGYIHATTLWVLSIQKGKSSKAGTISQHDESSFLVKHFVPGLVETPQEVQMQE